MGRTKNDAADHSFTDYTLGAYTVTNVPCVHNPDVGKVIKGKNMYHIWKLIEYMRKNHLQVLAFDANVI